MYNIGVSSKDTYLYILIRELYYQGNLLDIYESFPIGDTMDF